MSTYVIKQVRSANGANAKQRDTLRSLGLRKIGQPSRSPTRRSCAGCSTRCAT